MLQWRNVGKEEVIERRKPFVYLAFCRLLARVADADVSVLARCGVWCSGICEACGKFVEGGEFVEEIRALK